MSKVFNVKVSEDHHKVLKAYSAWLDSNMSELTAEVMMDFLQKTACCCKHAESLLNDHDIPPDPRRDKPCYGPACFYCENSISCKAGGPEFLKVKKHYIPLLQDEYSWMANLDGTSFSPKAS